MLWACPCTADMHNDLMYLASSLDLVICHCKPSNCAAILPESSAVGSINISSVSSGRCIAKLEAWDDADRRAALAGEWNESSM